MSVAMPAQKSGPGSTVSIFGRKISWDALLVAGAGLLGVIFLYRVGQPSAAVPAALQSSDTASGGGSAGLSTTQAMPASTAPSPFTSSGFVPNYGASTPTPLPNTPGPPPSGPGGSRPLAGQSLVANLPQPSVQQAVAGFGSIPVIGSVLARAAGSAPYAGSSPVNAVGQAAVPGRPSGKF